eukprot:gb/GECH01008217.1/.p1 GENE.gb/GECH01008217.1/~~gb/GECH01008217.1/.p1  ORF type:complete len:152 (+),score=36.15 gb/GECH01008217.1/:1-456(+)
MTEANVEFDLKESISEEEKTPDSPETKSSSKFNVSYIILLVFLVIFMAIAVTSLIVGSYAMNANNIYHHEESEPPNIFDSSSSQLTNEDYSVIFQNKNRRTFSVSLPKNPEAGKVFHITTVGSFSENSPLILRYQNQKVGTIKDQGQNLVY